MKAILWIIGAALVALAAASCALGANVAINGQPTAWGTCK